MRIRTAQLLNVIQALVPGRHRVNRERAELPKLIETGSTRVPLLERRSAIFWLLAASIPFYVLLALIVPPWDDELYYWCWSQDLQFSYYDHPPMVAYMIRLSTAIFGHSILAIRFPCLVSALVVLGVVTRLSRPRDLIPFVFLSPVTTFAAVMITPDVPLLMFWSLYVLWLVWMHRLLARETNPGQPKSIEAWHWVLGGVVLGCGVLGKYTTGLAAISGFFTFLAAGQWRRWLAGYTLHGFVSVLVASPILIHNIRHDFVPILFQWEHSMSSQEPGLLPFAEYVGVQWLLFGTLPFFVFGWALWNWKALVREPRLRVCTCLFTLPFAFFLFKSTRGHLEGNWSFPCYLACWPLAAELYARVRGSKTYRYLTAATFVLPLGASTFIACHAIEPIPLMPVESDRSTRQWDKFELIRQVIADIHDSGYDGPLYVPTYQWVSVFRWYGIDARQQNSLSRPSHFTERPNPPIDPARFLVFQENLSPTPIVDPELSRHYRAVTSRQLFVRKQPWAFYHIIDYSVPPATRAIDGKKS